MANKSATEIRAKTQDELKQALIDLKKEQFNLRFQKANGQLENTARARVVRRPRLEARGISEELTRCHG